MTTIKTPNIKTEQNFDKYIDILLQRPNPWIREELFVQRYLPMLFDPNPAIFNYAWLNQVATNMFLEVDVKNEKGETLFTVPPLRRSYPTTLDPALTHFAHRIERERVIHKKRAIMFMDQGLPALLHFERYTNPEDAKRWRDILKRYGYERQLTQNDTVKDDKADSTGVIYDDIDW
jgi:hypothetical protein